MESNNVEGDVDDGDLLKELRIGREQRDDQGGSSRRWPWLVAGLLVAALLAAAGVWWFSQARAVEVHVVTAVKPSAGAGEGAVLQATGYVTARRKATVSAQIIGTLSQVLIEEGDHVKKGQVLATLDSKAQTARLKAAKASSRASRATLQETRVELAQAKRDMHRQKDLAGQHLVSKQKAELAETKVANLKAQLAAQQAQLGATEQQEHVAQVNYDYTFVRAPFAGVITQKSAQVGEIVSPSAAGGGFTVTGIGTIVDMSSLEVDVDVNEAYISRVTPGMDATAVLDAYPDWKIPAHVIAIVPTADRGKATVKVRVAFNKLDPRILPNMGVRVSFLESSQHDKQTAQASRGVLVPASAIVERDHHQVVFAVHGHTAVAVRVTPAKQTYGDRKLLPEHVQAGQKIVAKPPDALSDGSHVKIAGSS